MRKVRNVKSDTWDVLACAPALAIAPLVGHLLPFDNMKVIAAIVISLLALPVLVRRRFFLLAPTPATRGLVGNASQTLVALGAVALVGGAWLATLRSINAEDHARFHAEYRAQHSASCVAIAGEGTEEQRAASIEAQCKAQRVEYDTIDRRTEEEGLRGIRGDMMLGLIVMTLGLMAAGVGAFLDLKWRSLPSTNAEGIRQPDLEVRR